MPRTTPTPGHIAAAGATPSAALSIRFDSLATADAATLARDLAAAGGRLRLRIACERDGNASYLLDVADDYLEAAYIGERLAPHCREIRAAIVDDYQAPVYVFVDVEAEAADAAGAARELVALARIRSSADALDVAEFRELADAFASQCVADGHRPALPNVFDHYLVILDRCGDAH